MQFTVDPAIAPAVAAWMAMHQPACLRCKGNQFATGTAIDLPEKTTHAPFHVVPIVCMGCGHVELLSAAVLLGIVQTNPIINPGKTP